MTDQSAQAAQISCYLSYQLLIGVRSDTVKGKTEWKNSCDGLNMEERLPKNMSQRVLAGRLAGNRSETAVVSG